MLDQGMWRSWAFSSASDWINASSEGLTRLWRSGAPYRSHQKISHMKPRMPAATKAPRHPKAAAMNGMVADAMMAPTLAPELNSAVENARSRLGNHRAVAFTAAGKFP